MAPADPTIKLVIVGNGSVGKSSIIARFTNDGFEKVYAQTVGVDFFERKIVLRGDRSVRLQLWDIGGQSLSSKMLSKYISGAAVAFLAYDITDRASFADVDDWLKMVRGAFTDKYTGDRLKMPRTYLLGNKIDLMTQCQVPELYHKQLIDRESLDGGFRVSAKSGEKLVASFYKAAGEAVGIKLREDELAYYERVLGVSTTRADGDEDGEGGERVADGKLGVSGMKMVGGQLVLEEEAEGGCKCAVS